MSLLLVFFAEETQNDFKMIEIYKTNITKKEHALSIEQKIKKRFPHYHITFDLEDCDRILRIDTFDQILNHNAILELVTEKSFYIEVLPDEVPLFMG